MSPLISICIPAYKNVDYLDVLLHSIEIQTFKNFEVVVTDDSPNNEVEILCRSYEAKFLLRYQKNSPAKGSPANWNEGIRIATGSWIKMMHDDDWFSDAISLEKFAKAIDEGGDVSFLFSDFSEFENGQFKKLHTLNTAAETALRKSPLILFSKNYIGHPSTTMIKNDRSNWYDERIKWVVDIEFYMRALAGKNFLHISQPLINIGINKDQITKAVFRNPAIEIPENIYLLNKLGTKVLKNIVVFDYYWRLLRNLDIRKIEDLTKYTTEEIPAPIERMLLLQRKIPLSVLKVGVFSKPLMLCAYFMKTPL